MIVDFVDRGIVRTMVQLFGMMFTYVRGVVLGPFMLLLGKRSYESSSTITWCRCSV